MSSFWMQGFFFFVLFLDVGSRRYFCFVFGRLLLGDPSKTCDVVPLSGGNPERFMPTIKKQKQKNAA